jgi:MFS transporter, ACS family, solute carrier family 17 (sodium-dependent inorganic phosphate cotransporter), other
VRDRLIAVSEFGTWPRRHVLVALAFLGCVIAYTDRVNISVAAVAMKEHFGWTQTEKGLVLSAFFVGYFACMFIAGVIATCYGGKQVAGGAVLIWSFFTLLTPLAASLSLGVLIAARVGMGMGEAGLFPATYELFGRWIPLTERARAASRFVSGIPLGTVIGLTASGWLVGRYGWPAPFYLFGLAGIFWMVIWFSLVQNDPRADARIGAAERNPHPSIRPADNAAREPVPWRRLLLSRPVLAIVIAQFAGAWTHYVLLSWLPSYFRDVQGLSIANAGLFSAGPWLAMAVAMNIGGLLSDRMIRGGMSVTAARKIMQCGGLVLSGLFLLAMRGAHTPALALILMIAAMFALGFTWCGFATGILDVAPRHGGLLVGFSNTFGQIPGIIGVAVTGWLVDATGAYTAAFVLAAAIGLAGALVFGLYFNAQPIIE